MRFHTDGSKRTKPKKMAASGGNVLAAEIETICKAEIVQWLPRILDLTKQNGNRRVLGGVLVLLHSLLQRNSRECRSVTKLHIGNNVIRKCG